MKGDPEQLFLPQESPRPVNAVGMELVTCGWEQEAHSHRKAQLVLAVRGLVTCQAERGRWIVPSGCALWLPGDVQHSIRGVGEMELYCLFIAPELADELPRHCCTMRISSLLKELIIAVSHLPALYDVDGTAAPMIQTMLNELAVAPIEHLHLPMPRDSRLQRIFDGLRADSSDRSTAATWAVKIGMSERSLHRHILDETGMTFLRWRQQYQILLALEWLANGVAVQTVAMDLGYDSASAFITMFKKALGQPPGKYLAMRNLTT
ncbi:AraC-like DNA-binding protein [Sphingobium sp. B11D3B]|uniref:AraC family transcriptional regulator n=1 Tax=Sphingobium sp. B11D3B TaxID=2940575 RepID=UPI0022274E7B|nr:helix-turn-helix transcriptional regulator [Sphingobium sp. B11D3B]MCW2389609.1 AraC-like DNA-binding protein [Sphingobium sp. B11D3B]